MVTHPKNDQALLLNFMDYLETEKQFRFTVHNWEKGNGKGFRLL